MNKLLDELIELTSKYPYNYCQCLALKKNEHLMKFVLDSTNNIKCNIALKTRVFLVINNISELPKCCICGKLIEQDIYTLENGYMKKIPWDMKYLNELPCDNKECRHIVEDRRRCNTNLKKYGYKCVFESPSIQKQIDETNLKKYGTLKPGDTKEGRQKARETWMKKYGTDHPMKSEQCKEKSRQTCIHNFGTKTYAESDESKEKVKIKNYLRLKEHILNDSEIEFIDIDSLNKIKCIDEFWNTKIKVRCKKCGSIFMMRPNKNNYYKIDTLSSCRKCHPISGNISKPEKELMTYIKNIYDLEIQENSKKIIKPYELDMFFPDINLAIEYDGMYWHSKKSSEYHLEKTKRCDEEGIKLIHIFENDFIYRKEKILAMIDELFYNNMTNIDETKCTFNIINKDEARLFLNENHIDGFLLSNTYLGMFYNDELVSVGSFSKSKLKKYEWEMTRFANKLHYNISFAMKSVTDKFHEIVNTNSIVTYVDRRWSNGSEYYLNGFNDFRIIKPRHWYFKRNDMNLIPGYKVTSSTLTHFITNVDRAKSVHENMIDNNYLRIYDCGLIVMVKTY